MLTNKHEINPSRDSLPQDTKTAPLHNHEVLVASYEGGWGFFDNHPPQPEEFTVTRDDDLYIDILLGEKERPRPPHGPMSLERRMVAQEGMRQLFEAAWNAPEGSLSDIDEARYRLYEVNTPQYAHINSELYSKGRYVHYQLKPGMKYHQTMKGEIEQSDGTMKKIDTTGAFLHFGADKLTSNPKDQLDAIMRVYVHTLPEYNAHVAAEVVRRLRTDYNSEIYGKVYDNSTADSNNTYQREDNLLFYPHTHSDLAAIATILKDITKRSPHMFNKNAGLLDRAQQTDIPFVSLGEEPSQQDAVGRESFNSLGRDRYTSRGIARHNV